MSILCLAERLYGDFRLVKRQYDSNIIRNSSIHVRLAFLGQKYEIWYCGHPLGKIE